MCAENGRRNGAVAPVFERVLRARAVENVRLVVCRAASRSLLNCCRCGSVVIQCEDRRASVVGGKAGGGAA